MQQQNVEVRLKAGFLFRENKEMSWEEKWKKERKRRRKCVYERAFKTLWRPLGIVMHMGPRLEKWNELISSLRLKIWYTQKPNQYKRENHSYIKENLHQSLWSPKNISTHRHTPAHIWIWRGERDERNRKIYYKSEII